MRLLDQHLFVSVTFFVLSSHLSPRSSFAVKSLSHELFLCSFPQSTTLSSVQYPSTSTCSSVPLLCTYFLCPYLPGPTRFPAFRLSPSEPFSVWSPPSASLPVSATLPYSSFPNSVPVFVSFVVYTVFCKLYQFWLNAHLLTVPRLPALNPPFVYRSPILRHLLHFIIPVPVSALERSALSLVSYINFVAWSNISWTFPLPALVLSRPTSRLPSRST